MSTITRYIFKRLFSTFLIFMISLLGIVWLTQALRFLDIIVNNNVGISSFFALILYLIPDLTVTLMPTCILIACIMTHQRILHDHEMIAIRSLGYSYFASAKSYIILGLFGLFFMLAANLFIIPKAFQGFREHEHKLKNQFSLSMLKPGHFNVFKNTTIYISDRTDKNEFRGVFLQYDDQNSEKKSTRITIMAKKGLLEKKENDIILSLSEGTRQELDHVGNLTQLKFKNLTYNLSELTLFVEERTIKPYEKTILELFEPDKKLGKLANKRLRIEAHQRILLPFMALVSVLIVLAVHQNAVLTRQRKRIRGLTALIIGVAAQAFLYLFINLYTKANIFLPLAYGYVFILCIVGFFNLHTQTIRRHVL